jgi:anti-sigma factor RsiW
MNEMTEHDLQAYVDGRLDAGRRQAVEAYLAANPGLAAKAAAYRRQNDAMHTAFDAIADEPVPARFRKPARATWPALSYAAMAGCLAVGLATGWMVREPAVSPAALAAARSPLTPVSFARQAAVAHAVFSPEVLHPVEVGADQEPHLVKWLSKRLGVDVRPPDLNPAGFQLIGGRLLPATSGPAAQFMYQDARGQRLTLYVRTHGPDTQETAFRYEKSDGVGVFYWIDRDLGYALSGDIDRARLLEVAKIVYQQLAG